jgi:hypothetical protein
MKNTNSKNDVKYYLINFDNSYDTITGTNHPFTDSIALKNTSPLYPLYSKDCISSVEITEEEYNEE